MAFCQSSIKVKVVVKQIRHMPPEDKEEKMQKDLIFCQLPDLPNYFRVAFAFS